ncbi:hypothetical protein P3488_10525 [Vibrio parahaemolyticus]|nr:hypothetical protein [Vibrio parahaemolyticus]
MAKPKWPESKKDHIQSLLGTMPVAEVADKVGLPLPQILSACSRYGWSYAFNRKMPSRLNESQKHFIRKNAGNVSVSDMARYLNVPNQRIRSWASHIKISLRLPSSESVHSHIPDEDIELMRQLHDEGVNCAEIARKFDISHGYCWQVCNYLNRTDVVM